VEFLVNKPLARQITTRRFQPGLGLFHDVYGGDHGAFLFGLENPVLCFCAVKKQEEVLICQATREKDFSVPHGLVRMSRGQDFWFLRPEVCGPPGTPHSAFHRETRSGRICGRTW